jgi:hypothetical protein
VGVPSYMKCSSRRIISGMSGKKSDMLFSKKSGMLFSKKALQFHPVSLFGSTWGLNKLSKFSLSFSSLESLNLGTMHFWNYIDTNYFYYLHTRKSFLKLYMYFLNTLYINEQDKMHI